MRRSFIMWMVGAVAGVLCLLSAHGASAQVSCGATINADTTLTSSDPITQTPCADPNDPTPALTVDGAVTLDLEGFTIDCGSPNPLNANTRHGVFLINGGGTVKHGVITRCNGGVDTDAAGSVKVINVQAISNRTGFRMSGPANKITENIGKTNVQHGFVFETAAASTTVTGNVAINNTIAGFVGGPAVTKMRFDGNLAIGNVQGDGFSLLGSSNQFKRNVATNNDDHGFDVTGDDNKFQKNVAIGNGIDGFNVVGDGNSFKEDLAHANTQSGFGLVGVKLKVLKVTATLNQVHNIAFSGATSAKVIKNTAVGSVTADGISLICTDCLLVKNRSLSNDVSGINLVVTNFNNTLKLNVALGNGTEDLTEGNAACDANTWKKNIFITSNVAGGGPDAGTCSRGPASSASRARPVPRHCGQSAPKIN